MNMPSRGLLNMIMHASCLSFLLLYLTLYLPNYEARVINLRSAEEIGIRQKVEFEAGKIEARNSETNTNLRPLIGILSQPGDGDGYKIIDSLAPNDPRRFNLSYIAASYVKFVEAGGARAVPLIYNEPEESLSKEVVLVCKLVPFTTLPRSYSSVWPAQMALRANDEGDYFPVFGTCLGYELLSVIVSQDHHLMEEFKALAQPAPLLFSSDLAKQQSMFSWFPEDILQKITHENLAMENHKWGVSPEKWSATGPLADFFEVLTTTPDQENKLYVSTIQGRKYPVTGVQWHPEKNAFEWGIATIPHSLEAIEITQSVANFLVSEARKSSHSPSSMEEEDALLIYNYAPTFAGKNGPGFFDQAYAFW
ncbi:hypothetical protein O6H91_07G036200 [Diphasiastrum complanatum]|uniref:Uncharacterized protein n=1 Tax=Diphasiastrum complanatum TaxID=34168 RepID=A0ACC2D415_DIPCM|nr:hypothetical protein O6H91_07G036200 [Diphasiastrum complanatum]